MITRTLRMAAIVICASLVYEAMASDPEVEVRIIPSRVEAVVSHVGPYAGLSSTFVELLDWIEKYGWYPVERGVGVYHDDPTAVPAKKLRSDARIPVNVYGKLLPATDPGAENAHLERSEPRLVIAALHKGPYDKVLPTISMLFLKMSSLRLKPDGSEREVYLNDPSDTPPEELLTEVQLPVKIRGKADIGIYSDWGAFGKGIEAASLCFTAAGLTVTPIKAREINDGSFAKKIRVLYMPGGWAAHYARDINDKGALAIEDFVEKGGGYIGICAGSFYAAKEIIWANQSWPYDIDLFPGKPSGPIKTIAPWPRYATAKTKMHVDHPITAGGPETRTTLYYGGPVLLPEKDSVRGKAVSVLAHLELTGDPVMVAFSKGKGRVFLSAVHIEYDLTSTADHSAWPENEKGIDDPECDWDLLQSAARWVLGKKK